MKRNDLTHIFRSRSGFWLPVLICCLLAFFALDSAADQMDTGKLLEPAAVREAAKATEEVPIELEQNPLASDTMRVIGLGLEAPEFYLWSMIRDESWEEYQAFRKTPGGLVLLSSVSIMYKGGYVKKRPLAYEGYRLPKEQSDRIASETDDLSVDEQDHVEKKLAKLADHLLVLDTKHPRGGGYGKGFFLADLLLEQGGLFSGRPWDWENFMPRVLTIGGIVVGGLLLVELLRMILGLGSRTFRRPGGK